MKRRSFVGVVAAGSLLFSGLLPNVARAAVVDPVPLVPTGAPVVFYIPHADDEVLFMWSVILHHVLIGREVHVVLCSNGEPSGALDKINGLAVDNGWWIGTHFPAREGYEPLTPLQFGLKRTDEFVAALGQLGVPRSRIHFGPPNSDANLEWRSDLLPDAISRAWADEIIGGWADYFESVGVTGVGHYTMWWRDVHPDHAALGQSAHAYRVADPIKYGAVRWMVKPEEYVAAGASIYEIPANLVTVAKFMARKAVLCYCAWLPPYSFAIGAHSIGTTVDANGNFSDVTAGNPCYIVRNL